MGLNSIQYFFWFIILFACAITKDDYNYCERCVQIDDCPSFKHLSLHKQKMLLERVPCKQGFDTTVTSISAEIYVCCPNLNILENENYNRITAERKLDSTKSLIKRSANSEEVRQNKNNLSLENENLFSRDQPANGSLLPNLETCGINIYDTVSDHSEDKDVFPWSAFLISTFKQDNIQSVNTCEGVFITNRYVLTSASCVYRPGTTLDMVNVSFAMYGTGCGFLIKPDSPLEVYPECLSNVLAENVTAHEYFKYNSLLHDIALVRVKDESTRSIVPVCLPNFNIETKQLINEPLFVARWDLAENIKEALEVGIPRDTFVKEGSVVFRVANSECHRFYPNLSRTQFCAAGRDAEDIFDGISGSPLMLLNNRHFYVIGILSASRSKTMVGRTIPSLYTNVYRHILWIKRNLKD